MLTVIGIMIFQDRAQDETGRTLLVLDVVEKDAVCIGHVTNLMKSKASSDEQTLTLDSSASPALNNTGGLLH